MSEIEVVKPLKLVLPDFVCQDNETATPGCHTVRSVGNNADPSFLAGPESGLLLSNSEGKTGHAVPVCKPSGSSPITSVE